MGEETWLHHFKPETKTADGVASSKFSTEKEVQGCTFQGRWGRENFEADRCTCNNVIVQGIRIKIQKP
jgi:hypothetical protein